MYRIDGFLRDVTPPFLLVRDQAVRTEAQLLVWLQGIRKSFENRAENACYGRTTNIQAVANRLHNVLQLAVPATGARVN